MTLGFLQVIREHVGDLTVAEYDACGPVDVASCGMCCVPCASDELEDATRYASNLRGPVCPGCVRALKVVSGEPQCGHCGEFVASHQLRDVSDYSASVRRACEGCAYELIENAHDWSGPCSCGHCGVQRRKADAWGSLARRA